jgi:hypothetical protein
MGADRFACSFNARKWRARRVSRQAIRDRLKRSGQNRPLRWMPDGHPRQRQSWRRYHGGLRRRRDPDGAKVRKPQTFRKNTPAKKLHKGRAKTYPDTVMGSRRRSKYGKDRERTTAGCIVSQNGAHGCFKRLSEARRATCLPKRRWYARCRGWPVVDIWGFLKNATVVY